ncbi:MAG: peptidyl-prolyl cis-trans isomerase [Candidatus Omnitrophica bacterium]|nr:peptidyl-prolyl cis-trans isomerase [Candidatus Omnitrophota bacterium]MDE2214572.1 peptidyl-prolyl cis-trans isomerase [Candidatus Omnitrophota bacterium]
MKRPAIKMYGPLCLIAGLVFLTGCDQIQNLLGLGSKKQEASQQQAPVVPAAPVTPVSPVVVAKSTPVAQEPLPGDALVRIGDWTLTQQEFNDRLDLLKQQLAGMKQSFKESDAKVRSYVLDQLVRQELLVREAQDSGAGDSQSIKNSVRDFRRTLMVQEVVSRLTRNVAATESDARAYYDTHKSDLTTPVTWNVSEIVAPDEATAKTILVQVLQGGDFAQLARSQSKASDAAVGGKIKPFVTGEAPFEAMQTAIANLGPGDVSGVFKGPQGYYIVKVDSKTGGVLKPFTDYKDQIIYFLTQQKQQEVMLKHLNELAEKYKPEYNKTLIDQVVGQPSQTGR